MAPIAGLRLRDRWGGWNQALLHNEQLATRRRLRASDHVTRRCACLGISKAQSATNTTLTLAGRKAARAVVESLKGHARLDRVL